MTVLKPPRPLQPIKPSDPARPKHIPKKPRLAYSAFKSTSAEEIPEFGTGAYVTALKKQDAPQGSLSTLRTATSSISAMWSGEWLNPTHPMPNYLGYGFGLVG